jgi:hypothetical protein
MGVYIVISEDSIISKNEFDIEMYRLMSKIHVVNLALKEEENSNIAIRCSTVLEEIDKEFQVLQTLVNENRIKGEF